jgi:hypothetical protein
MSGSFGLCSDLMNEETVPVVAQALNSRLQAPCTLGFLLIALLSQSVTIARLSLSRHRRKKRRPP